MLAYTARSRSNRLEGVSSPETVPAYTLLQRGPCQIPGERALLETGALTGSGSNHLCCTVLLRVTPCCSVLHCLSTHPTQAFSLGSPLSPVSDPLTH